MVLRAAGGAGGAEGELGGATPLSRMCIFLVPTLLEVFHSCLSDHGVVNWQSDPQRGVTRVADVEVL